MIGRVHKAALGRTLQTMLSVARIGPLALVGIVLLCFPAAVAGLKQVRIDGSAAGAVDLYFNDNSWILNGTSVRFPANQTTLPGRGGFNDTTIASGVYAKWLSNRVVEVRLAAKGLVASVHVVGVESYVFTYDGTGNRIVQVDTHPSDGKSVLSSRRVAEATTTGNIVERARLEALRSFGTEASSTSHGSLLRRDPDRRRRRLTTPHETCQQAVAASCLVPEPIGMVELVTKRLLVVKWVKNGGLQAAWSRTVALGNAAKAQYVAWNKKFLAYKKKGNVKLANSARAKSLQYQKTSNKHFADAAKIKKNLDTYVTESKEALKKIVAFSVLGVSGVCGIPVGDVCQGQCAAWNANAWGDPHLVTFDGLAYDCQAEGEMILTKTLGSDLLEVQGRFTPWGSHSYVTVTTGLVIKVRGLPKIQVSLDAESSMRFLVNGTEAPVANGIGYEAKQEGSSIVIAVPSLCIYLQVHDGGSYLNYDLSVGKSALSGATVVGLFGIPNGNSSDDWMMPDGTPLGVADGSNLLFETAYKYCTSTWCIRNASASLFSYLEGESFAGYSKCDKTYDSTIETVLASPPQCLVDSCGQDNQECILEGIAMGRAGVENARNVKDASLCLPRLAKACYFSCANALASTCDATSGLYKICANEGGPSTTVYCDQATDGGGWMLLYSYKHLSGENKPVNGSKVPLDPANGYSHFHLNQLPGFAASAVESVRFFCRTSGHDRVLHFKNAHPVASAIAFSGNSVGNYAGVWNDDVCYVSNLAGHTADLPKSTDIVFASSSDGFLYFPFFSISGGSPAHWAIASNNGYADRYECDDFLGDSLPEAHATNTTHNVWVKVKEKCCAYGYGTFKSVGLIAGYTVKITHDSEGIRTEYPSLNCGHTAYITPNKTAVGRLEWLEVLDFGAAGACEDRGTISLVADKDLFWTYSYTYAQGTRGDTGQLSFECNRSCGIA
jgi:von Willebrand factor type D domain